MAGERKPSYDITVIPGDGIGREIIPEMLRVVEATGVHVRWDQHEAGQYALGKSGNPLPEATLASLRRTGVGIKGPTGTPIGSGFRSVNVAMRQYLNLFACVRPVKYLPGVSSPLKNPEGIDYVIIRENTEDLYAGIEFERDKPVTRMLMQLLRKTTGKAIALDSAIAIKPISASASDRIVRYAFEHAKSAGRTKVTAVTKSNIMKFTDGLFL